MHEEARQQIQTDNTRKQSEHGGISVLCNLNKQCLTSSRMSHEHAYDLKVFFRRADADPHASFTSVQILSLNAKLLHFLDHVEGIR